MQREMRQPSQFGKACTVAYIMMACVYSVAVVLAYGLQGDGVPGFLPDSLEDGPLKTGVGVCLAYHIAISYLVCSQPLCAFTYHKLFGGVEGAGAIAQAEWISWARLRWLAISLTFLSLAALVANAVPFFADLQELVGALGGAPIMFGWPALFYVRAMASHDKPLAAIDKVLCTISLLVCTPIFTIMGTASAIDHILAHLSTQADAAAASACGHQ